MAEAEQGDEGRAGEYNPTAGTGTLWAPIQIFICSSLILGRAGQ
jgi:hypothetical protein